MVKQTADLFVRLSALLLLVLAAASCATTTSIPSPTALQPQRRPPPTPSSISVLPLEFHDEDAFAFVDGKTGRQISLTEVVQRLRVHKVVVVGEQHDQASHHEFQRRVVETLVGDGPGLVVGLEMLTWEKQPELDRFNRGDLDVDGLRETVDWKKAWGFDFNFYAPILVVGHAGGARFVALNAPRSLVRAVRQKGLERLTPADRAQIPELDLDDQLHRAWFEQVFTSAGHPLKAAELDGFYRAQVLWDEAMAEGAARAVKAGARQVVVLAGAGHVASGRGIPQRVERRLGTPVLALVPLSGIDSSNAVDTITKAVRSDEGDILVIPRFEAEIVL